MSLISSFETFDTPIAKEFLRKGYLVQPCENLEGLKILRETVLEWAISKTSLTIPEDKETFFNNFHHAIGQDEINTIRMDLYTKLNAHEWSRPTYFSFGKSVLETILGNELVMQNRINVNIMLSGDVGSNIPLHIDAHSGESPFQCVMWLPLTDTYDTKSVFLLPLEKHREALKHFKNWMQEGGQKRVMREIQSDVIWADVPFGSFLLFSPNLIHGSVVNETDETRWSLNTRFKSLFSPYTSEEKGLGSFYLPVRVAPATKWGLEYTKPTGM